MSETDTVYLLEPSSSSWLPSPSHPIPNRAMNFGDGLFETMVFDGTEIRFFPHHLARLDLGMSTLRMNGSSAVVSGLETWLQEKYDGQRLRVRCNVFRGGVGKYTPETNEVVFTLHIQSFYPAPMVKPLASFSETVSLHPSKWSQCKTLNALPYVMAAIERKERGLDELILLDSKGKIAEASSSNIFWRKGKKVYTPGLECGCITGVGRRAVLEKIPRLVTQGSFNSNELLNADQVWVTNVTGISYLEKIDSLEFSTEAWEPLLEIFE